jgi:DNA-directed RNA polymerase specialized sigma24 family protein
MATGRWLVTDDRNRTRDLRRPLPDHVDRVTGFAVRRLSNPGEVADLVAATFLAALERSDSYDPAKGDAGAWLLGIAANLLANQRRRAVREQLARARFDARALLSPDDVEALVARMDASDEAARLRAPMETLSEPHQQVLLLASEILAQPGCGSESFGNQPHCVSGSSVPGPPEPAPSDAVPARQTRDRRRRHNHEGGPDMTPTADIFEDRLLDALLDRFDNLASPPPAPMATAHRRGSMRRHAVPLAGLAIGLTAASLTLVEIGGPTPANHVGPAQGVQPATSSYALAAWTAQPTSAAPGLDR